MSEKTPEQKEASPSQSVFQNHIHWYPGHIAKAERKLKEQINLVDVVIEVLDARIPLSSCYNNIESLLGEKPRLILLNKADLAPEQELKNWIKVLEEKFGCPVLMTDAKNSNDLNKIVSKAVELSEPRIQKLMAKGLLRRSARVMVVGMPNVGKSSIINKLTRSAKTKVGAKAGVTRQQQWVKVNPKIDLLDTPGIIPMKQEDQLRAKKLAFVNSVSENAYEQEAVAIELLQILSEKYANKVREYYNLNEMDDLTIENIAKSRNWIVRGSEADINRTATFILRDFREGKMGKFILD
jgi:ribosome biogenesis GTPase A